MGVVVFSCILALLAMGFTLQYITLGVPNLAYTTIAFASPYLSLLMTIKGLSPYCALPFGFIMGGVISILLYKFMAFLRDRKATTVTLMMSTLCLSLIMYGAVNIIASYMAKVFTVYTFSFSLTQYDFNIGTVPGILIVSSVTAVTLALVFHVFLVKTKFGIGMRAVMENYSLSAIQGIDTEKILIVAWFFVGGVAGISGALYPLWFSMDPLADTRIFIDVFAACIVGGVRSIYGSLLGGFLIAASETLVTYGFTFVLGNWVWSYRALPPMILSILTLLWMPEGIAGYVQRFSSR